MIRIDTKLHIPVARVFQPLLGRHRYCACHSGRGAGKSHFFAGKLISDAMREPGDTGSGLLAVCVREVQKSLKESAKRLIESKLVDFGLGESDGFRVYEDKITTPGDGIIIFQGLCDHTAESIKSLEGFKRAWVEEAQTLSSRSLQLLRPTIRDDDSELWFGWNPRRKNDPVDLMLRGEALPTGALVVKANWSDNPWFPKALNAERLDCLAHEPDQYDHIWEGGYAIVMAGAYYAKQLAEARGSRRIGRVSPDPLMTTRAVWDIGGTGAKADACAIWICQFVGRAILWLDYYEASGQPLATHIKWLRSNGYGDALCVLPHDGASNDKVYDVSYESALRAAGFECVVVPNQGKGAAMARIESARRLFPSMWFNEETCRGGIEAIGAYHAKVDESRGIDLGPEHDFSSHGSDAFGLACIVFETPKEPPRKRTRGDYAGSKLGWMGG